MSRKSIHWPELHETRHQLSDDGEIEASALLALNMKNLILLTVATLAAAIFLTGPEKPANAHQAAPAMMPSDRLQLQPASGMAPAGIIPASDPVRPAGTNEDTTNIPAVAMH